MMLNNNKGTEVELIRATGHEQKKIIDLVAIETFIDIYINQNFFISLNCSPGGLKYLTTGFLYNSGIVNNKKEIISTKVRENKIFFEIKNDLLSKGIINFPNLINQIKYSGVQGQKRLSVNNDTNVKIDIIYSLVSLMQEKAVFFQKSGAVHSCGLADIDGSIILFSEDIGRYNTIDRVSGEAFLGDIKTYDKVILTSCRITSGIMQKIVRTDIPIVISRAAVTDYAIKLADRRGITLVGFARGERLNIYTHAERVVM